MAVATKKFDKTMFSQYQDPDLIGRAFEFAETAHGEQNRKSGEPYVQHPLRVAQTLSQWHLDQVTIIAGLLHDVAEDTPFNLEDISKEFGEEVAFLVDGVTKLGTIKYRGVERQVENLRKMILAMAQDIRVILIKLADRLDNMQSISALPPEKQLRVALETLEIYGPLAGRLGMGSIKSKLEDLAFPIVLPKEYNWMMNEVKTRYKERQKYVESLVPILTKVLNDEGVKNFEIGARAKTYYSLYQKLLRLGMDLKQVHDLVALRIIVETVEQCYLVLGIIHTQWKPIPGRFKDYIALPKPNGYRSLHTSVFSERGQICEVQIRTRQMHDEAENGIAAYWAYSESKGGKTYVQNKAIFAPAKDIAWIGQLRKWQQDIGNKVDSHEFLETLKIDFFKDRLFVFTPKGDVIDLPGGATPIDFAYRIHSDLGNQCNGAKVNAAIVPLDYELRSGDIVEILTSRNQKPSEARLFMAKTTYARGKIKGYLRQLRVEGPAKNALPVEFLIHAKDRVGIIKDISSTFSNSGINILSLDTKVKALTAFVKVKCEHCNKNLADELVGRLKKVKNVESIIYRFR